MGHKLVCFNCRIAKNLNSDFTTLDSTSKICNMCYSEMKLLSHRFRPPKKEAFQKWKVVEFLYENGFRYEHVADDEGKAYAIIPENMNDAKDFVRKYLIN